MLSATGLASAAPGETVVHKHLDSVPSQPPPVTLQACSLSAPDSSAATIAVTACCRGILGEDRGDIDQLPISVAVAQLARRHALSLLRLQLYCNNKREHYPR
jgi:hypothetical protein